MGSAAFLNEVIDQLADAYLERKQQELNDRIPYDRLTVERQKIKMFIADRNVYGIDKNPLAMELAEVSIWLNCIYGEQTELENGLRRQEQVFVPWFGGQLHCGNSLVGARRQVYPRSQVLANNKGVAHWYESAPDRIKLGKPLAKGAIFHFLLGDPGMTSYSDKVIKELEKDNLKLINDWQKGFCKSGLSPEEADYAERLSQRLGELWESLAQEQIRLRDRTTDDLPIWGQHSPSRNNFSFEGGQGVVKTLEGEQGVLHHPNPTQGGNLSVPLSMKDKIYEQEKLSKGVANSSFYRRLKMVMDYWCALWFWPITEAEMLPTRLEFLNEVGMILGEMEMVVPAQAEQLLLFPETQEPKQGQLSLKTWGFVDLEQLKLFCPRLQVVEELSTRHRFFHWELEFADLFLEQDGFDLMVGNPPWLKVEWSEGDLLGDYDPMTVIRKLSAAQFAKVREELFNNYGGLKSGYLAEYEEAAGTQNFLNAVQNYPLLQGQKTNLYKCFIPQGWQFSNNNAIQGFIHQESIYDDKNAGLIRAEVYQRLIYHLQFRNQLLLFKDIDKHQVYSINIYRTNKQEVSFKNISSLFHTKTVYECFEHTKNNSLKGIKDEYDNWNLEGHQKRIFNIDITALKLFKNFYGDTNTLAIESKLPDIYSQELLSVLSKYSKYDYILKNAKEKYISTPFWNETNAEKDGTILNTVIDCEF